MPADADRVPAKARAKKAAVPSRSAEITTVVVVDDHPLWRQTLRAVIEGDGSAAVVGEGTDGGDALPLVTELRPAVLLLDMDLPTLHGVDALAQVVEARPTDGSDHTRVLVLSASDDPEIVLSAVRAGADGYMLKTADASDIRTAVRRVAGGELVFPSQMSELVRRGLRGDGASAPAGGALSPREIEVLDLMAEGLSNVAIGKQLFLSSRTVETHISTIFSKLGLEPTDDVHRRVRAVVAHLSSRNARSRARGTTRSRL